LACLGSLVPSSYGQETNTQLSVIKVEMVKSKDLRRTAHRLHITIEQLTNARTALKEATDLALRQDPPAPNDYSTLARLWVQMNRQESLAMIASLIEQLCKQAQAADDLNAYRKYTTPALQLLYMLFDLDIEKAKQIADLWPAPATKLGDAAQQVLTQFQSDFSTRLMSQGSYALADQSYEQYLQPEKSASLPFAPRVNVASALISANQKEKARALLDQAVADLAKRPPDPSKNGDTETFLRGLVNLYPEKFIDAFDNYKEVLSRQDTSANPGIIYQVGDEKILLDPSESALLNMIRGIYGRPELALKLLESNPGLRAKLNQLGGLDNFFNRSMLSGTPMPISYPANAQPPVIVTNPPGASSDGRQNSAVPEKPINLPDLLQSLRGKAALNPEMVRRKLAEIFQKKEQFSLLMNLAQSASYPDPDLASIALEVARGLLPLFDSLQQRSSSIRSLIMIARQIDGEVDPTLLREGFNLVTEMRDEEKQRAPAADRVVTPGAAVVHPSDDFEFFLIAQNALDDFGSAIRRAHSIEVEGLRMKALLQIAQVFTANY
jgi:hypothetical protein